MLSKTEVLNILVEAGVLQEGHFLLTSGRHSAKYLQCARIFQDAKYAVPLCGNLAEQFKEDGIELVVGPAVGAVQMAYEVSRQLGVPNFFFERQEGKMTLRRGFEIKPGTRVLVVEDVVTTGGTVVEVINEVKAAGGIVAGAGIVVDRTGGKVDFGCPLKSVVSVEVESYEPDNCPLCKAGMGEAVKLGSRKI